MVAESKRINWVDISKGIAIICVIMGHVATSYHDSRLFLSDASVFNFLHQLVYSFHMALFMILSGYLYAMSSAHGKNIKNTKKVKIINKLITYGIPYLVFSVIYIVFKMAMGSVTNHQVGILDLVLIPIYPISFMWFLYALMIMHIIQDLLGDLSFRGKIIHVIIAAVCKLIQPILCEHLLNVSFSDTIFSDFMAFWIYYVIGCYGLQYFIDCVKDHKLAVMGLCIAYTFVFNILSFTNIFDMPFVSDFMVSLTGSLAVIYISMALGKSSILQYCGKNSLVIYLVHGYVVPAMRLVLTKFNLNYLHGMFPMVICTVVALLASILVYEISRRIHLDFFFFPGRYIKYQTKH